MERIAKVLNGISMAFLCILLITGLAACSGNQIPGISIITDETYGSPVEYGIAKLSSQLDQSNIAYEKVSDLSKARGEILVVAGLSGGTGEAAKLLSDTRRQKPEVPEAFSIWNMEIRGKPAWVLTGYDDRGLMYSLLDAAERLQWSNDIKDPFSELEATFEKPDVSTRAVSLYTMNRAYWESRFYDEAYWASYMDMLAKNRFNSLVLIFGYENAGFLAPCYPYFFEVEGFPDIGMEGMNEAEQTRNLSALNRMIDMAHQRGLDFKVGIWDHIYRGGIQAGGIPEEELANRSKDHLVKGLDADNLSAYTRAALAKFIQMVPGLDGIQLRMHNESGLERGEEMEIFWTEVFGMMKATAPGLKIELRAKELPESIIQIAREMNLDFTVTTKYWMEQLGLPFHPTHINRENQLERRHGYADMLRYPQEYKILWRLWSGGTQRVLLWGDPGYVRRFSESTHLYDGVGFEINEALATKMEAQPHDEEPFDLLNPPYRYYDYEFERYWHFFQVFGRLSYNPDTSPEVWIREFNHRFGKEAGPYIQEALHKASAILPRVMAACAPYGKFPTTMGWAEKQRFGDLPQYANAEGSDIQQFASFDTEAKLLIENGASVKTLPSSTSLWFLQTHQEIEELIGRARLEMSGNQNKEFQSTLCDLSILSNLALYHSRRIPAAVSYCIFERTGDPHALDDAIAYESKAIEAWRNMVAATADIYASDIKMGVREYLFMDIHHHLTGHWRDELGYLENGLEDLKSLRSTLGMDETARTAPLYQAAPELDPRALFQIQHQAVRTAPLNENITIRATVTAPSGIRWVRLRFRSVNQHLDYKTLDMTAEAGSDSYEATVPAGEMDEKYDFMYFLEVMDMNGYGRMYPDFNLETPYFVVKLER